MPELCVSLCLTACRTWFYALFLCFSKNNKLNPSPEVSLSASSARTVASREQFTYLDMSLHERKLPQRDTYTTKKVNCVLWKGDEAAAHVILGHHHPSFPIIWVCPVKLSVSSTHVPVHIDIVLNVTKLCNETETVWLNSRYHSGTSV